MEHFRAVSAEWQPCVTRKTADPSHLEKAIKSTNSNYTEDFTELVKRIPIFKSDIADRSLFDSMAEMRDIRVEANATREDVQALPATPLNPMIAGTSYQPVSASDRIKGTYEKETLQMYCKMLSKHIFDEGTMGSLWDIPRAVALPSPMLARLRDWISSEESEILWVAGPEHYCYPSKMSAVAATMVALFTEEKPTAVFHFCDLPLPWTVQGGESREEIGLMSMVYSMIQQLIDHVPPRFDSSKDLGLKRFTPLDGNVSTLDGALELLRDLIPLCLPYLVIIIDGIEQLDDWKGQHGCKEFVKTLRQCKPLKPRDDEPQRVYKVLFTTAGKRGALMETLDSKEILLQDDIDNMELGTAAFSGLGPTDF